MGSGGGLEIKGSGYYEADGVWGWGFGCYVIGEPGGVAVETDAPLAPAPGGCVCVHTLPRSRAGGLDREK